MTRVERWMAERGWRAFPYQKRVWRAYADGHGGLVHAPTGTGKSYAVWLAAIEDWLSRHPRATRWPKSHVPLQVLWITPMRALANDLVKALARPISDMGLPWSVELRTGDTTAAIRARQRKHMPSALVTTPESLSLLLSYPESRGMFGELACVVVDEWHELLGTKRGAQVELALARLRNWNADMRTWGLSATLGNLPLALETLLGDSAARGGLLVDGDHAKTVHIETIIPEDIERFPWAGHLGMKLLPRVIERIERARTTLVFTNVRSQAERWFQAILAARRDWAAELALHHGSLDRGIREYVEGRLRRGDIRCVVCTSSLDLGVDFSPVDQVIQIGSPKGIARLLQRAGRAGHQPGAASHIVCVPTHAFELVEYAAVREASNARALEPREPCLRPLDVLAQHLVTMALAEPFEESRLAAEVRATRAFRDLTDDEWRWCVEFVTGRGPVLNAYPEYARLVHEEGRLRVASSKVARLHRMSIGTITGDSSVSVRLLAGRVLGTIEESFIARLKPGETFIFAGKALKLVLWKDMTAFVRRSKDKTRLVPRWDGGKLPLSTQLAAEIRRQLDEAREGRRASAEMRAVGPILELQDAVSRVPKVDELLIELTKARDGHQCFVYPFEGRLAHEGLSALLAHRLSRLRPRSFTMTVNDYGFELLSDEPIELPDYGWRRLFSRENLLEDLLSCLNATELARRQFREIARVAGLIFQGYPGSHKTARQLQASSGLLFDVFNEYDPRNLLLEQARREVLERQLEAGRLSRALERIESLELVTRRPERMTPLGFPLWAARIQTTHLTSEKWADRVSKMALRLESAAGAPTPQARKPRARNRVSG